jgi:hypothetical protein
MSDEGKTNTNGRIDEHGAFRHRLPELCPVGALAIHLFAYFHVEGPARLVRMTGLRPKSEVT